MNFRHVWIVFKKEVKDIARDRRTLFTNLLIPIVLMPLLFTFLGGGMEKMVEDIENISIALTAESDTAEIRELLEKQVFADFPNIQFKESVENPSEAILQKEVRFVLEVENDFADLLARGEPYTLTIHYDQSDTNAAGSMGILNQAIQSYSRQLVQQRLTDLNIDPQILEPVRLCR